MLDLCIVDSAQQHAHGCVDPLSASECAADVAGKSQTVELPPHFIIGETLAQGDGLRVCGRRKQRFHTTALIVRLCSCGIQMKAAGYRHTQTLPRECCVAWLCACRFECITKVAREAGVVHERE